MKNRIVISIAFVLSLACQAIVPPPPRDGTVISDCSDLVREMGEIQPLEPPKEFLERGFKTGDEFDANEYFKILTHISMRDTMVLDYVYSVDFLGSYPILYARFYAQDSISFAENVPEGMQLPDYHEYLKIEDVEQGYFEAVVMEIMASQFYLVWHANYNDTQIVCDKDSVDRIVNNVNDEGFGMKFDANQMTQIRTLTNIEPAVTLTETSAIVEVVVFTKWGGFYRQTYTISRSFPHVIEMKEENLAPYDCGIMF